MNSAVPDLRFFVEVTLGRAGFGACLAATRSPERLPVVLSTDEVARLRPAAEVSGGAAPSPTAAILVNSVGAFVTSMVGDPDANLAAFDRQVDVNVRATVAAVRASVPPLAKGGRIVSIGTTGAVHIPFAGAAGYVATKAAVAAHTRGWVRDRGPRNITVNVIQPGAINADMNSEDGAFAETLNKLAALGCYGQPEDVAAAVAFLVGLNADYITGATLNVDGGQSA